MKGIFSEAKRLAAQNAAGRLRATAKERQKKGRGG